MKCQNCSNEKMRLVQKEKTPVWAIVLAILLFPFGLLFLFAKSSDNYFVCDECGYKHKD